MKNWKTTLLVVVLVAVAIVGGLVFYTRSQVKRGIEDAVAAVAPFAGVQYKDFSVGLNGAIHINDIEVRPRFVNENVRVEGVDIDTPGIWFLLSANKNAREGKLPDNLRFAVRGIEINNGGPITESADRFIAMAAQMQKTRPMTNCGDISYLDLKAYRQLGYQTLVFDVAMGYRFERRDGPLQSKIEWRIRDLGALTFDFEIAGVPQTITTIAGVQPRVRTFAVSYQDLSFTNRFKRYCAQAAGIPVEQYVNTEVDRSDEAYQVQWGFVPGAGIRTAYRAFLNNPGEVRIQGSPPADFDMQSMRLFNPDDVVSMLNLRVSVNGKAITDLGVTTVAVSEPEQQPAKNFDAAVAAAEKAESAPRPTVTPSLPRAAPRVDTESEQFRNVPINGLGQHLNKQVRLTLIRGTSREGVLLQVTDGLVRIERRYGTGTMVLAVPLKEIERADVLF